MCQKLVMWRSTLRLQSLYQKNDTSHIEALYRSLIRFAKSTWFMTSEASFAWKPHDCFSICFPLLGKERSCSTWLGRGMGQMFYCFQKISHIRWCIIHVSIGPISLRVLYKMKVGSHPYCHLCNTSTVGSYLHVLGISSGGSFLEICMFCSFGFPAFR